MSARRVAIVTGASSGIGRALTERAVRAGWDVFAVGRRAERLSELERLTASAMGSLTTLALDLREPRAAARIIRETLAAYGRIDVLVNNAGGVAVGAVTDQSDDALYDQFETHAIVPLALTREALPSLRTSQGLVIYFGSGVARIPVGTLGAYPAAKAAVRSLARTARNELRPLGIAVTYVDPGAVATEFMTRAGFAGPPPSLAASPYDVARTVFDAFATRRPVVNAAPWQTLIVALGEALPNLTDYVLARAPHIVGGNALPADIGEKPVLPSHPVSASPSLAPPEPAPPEPAPSEPAPDDAPTIEPTVDAAIEAAVAQAIASAEADEPSVTERAPVDLEPEVRVVSFESALDPHENRMRKLNLRAGFVRSLLVPGSELELGYVAMRWAGMPNKNERGLTSDVLDALVHAGFLERLDRERFLVLREA